LMRINESKARRAHRACPAADGLRVIPVEAMVDAGITGSAMARGTALEMVRQEVVGAAIHAAGEREHPVIWEAVTYRAEPPSQRSVAGEARGSGRSSCGDRGRPRDAVCRDRKRLSAGSAMACTHASRWDERLPERTSDRHPLARSGGAD